MFRNWPPDSTAKTIWSPDEIYGALNDHDRALATTWAATKANGSHELARMLSARGAEKAALRFYQSLGRTVTDVAITQLNGVDQDWKYYDLLMDDGACVDVKNARKPVNSNTYVEHVVPRFKTDYRHNQDVLIFGVRSPYLELDHINDPNTIPAHWTDRNIYALGETSWGALNRVSQMFSHATLKIEPSERNVLPPWAFDFPADYYANRARAIETLHKCFGGGNLDFLAELGAGSTLIPALVASGIALPTCLQGTLEPWQAGFCDQLLSLGNISLSVLFLALLDHFLSMVKINCVGYNPDGYTELGFP